MLALFVKVPTMQRLRKIRSFFTDSKYSADHDLLPHISIGHVCKHLYSKLT